MDIHNTLEVIDAMEAAGKALKDARADGVVNIWDVPKLAPVISAGRKALEDSDQIILELKDLDDNETQVLVDRLFSASTVLLDALLHKPA